MNLLKFNWLSKIDWKHVFILAISGFFSILTYIYSKEIKLWLIWMFNIPWLNYALIGAPAVITIVHKIKFNGLKFNSKISFSDFKMSMEDMFSFISHPITVFCSFSLARGLYFQWTGWRISFPYLTHIEIIFIWIVTAYLLYVSITDFVKKFGEIIFKSKMEEVTPTQKP